MKKLFGFILIGVGVVAALASYAGIRTLVGLPSDIGVNDSYILIGGAVILILGAAIAFGGRSSKQAKEVPIYKGKAIVGYRQVK